MTDSDIRRPAEVRDLLAAMLDERPDVKAPTTPLGDKKLVVTFKDGTRAVLSVAVYRAQDSSEEKSDE